MQQIANTILMVRPVNFRMNEQTAVNNYYQNVEGRALPNVVNTQAQMEFDGLANKLREVGIQVIVVDDTLEPDTPDAVFPNNWISFHENGSVALYPMFAENRRLERREDVLDIIEDNGFEIKNIIDYSSAEEDRVFLEGTGSMVLDRINQKAYCALSQRTDEDLFIEFCEDFEFTPVIFMAFHSIQGTRKPIYHTNVMMSVGETFAIICLDCIDDKAERKNVLNHLKSDGKEVIAISESQVSSFAGNMLQVKASGNKSYLVMSEQAYNSMSKNQINALKKHTGIITSPLHTIEKHGGGGARCMMAEVFLPKGH